MKALVKRADEVGLRLEDVAEPTIGINDVLIRVERTGICGTDIHIWDWNAWAKETVVTPHCDRTRVRGADRRGRFQRE